MDQPQYILFTDGSGYKDGYGGWACRVKSPDDKSCDYFRMGAIIGCTVDRMELTAILEGLQIVLEITMEARGGLRGHDVLPFVKLYSDRENLILSIKGIYDRSNAPDLWARFAFYEKYLQIEPEHVLRENEHIEFEGVDLHASTGRIIAKNYGTAVHVPNHLTECRT